MHEDKLSHGERIRLECIAQAINSLGPGFGAQDSNKVVEVALKFEEYVLDEVPES